MTNLKQIPDHNLEWHSSSIKEILEGVKQSFEQMDAFTCASDKCMSKVADDAKKPMYGQNYIGREDILNHLESIISKIK